MANKDKETKKEQLNELNMNWAGKLFFSSIAAYLGGAYAQNALGAEQPPNIPIKIKGTPKEIKAVMDIITSSKIFQDELKRPGATIDDVIKKLNLRNLNKNNFKKITGKNWPL
jgi:hypothetical protein